MIKYISWDIGEYAWYSMARYSLRMIADVRPQLAKNNTRGLGFLSCHGQLFVEALQTLLRHCVGQAAIGLGRDNCMAKTNHAVLINNKYLLDFACARIRRHKHISDFKMPAFSAAKCRSSWHSALQSSSSPQGAAQVFSVAFLLLLR